MNKNLLAKAIVKEIKAGWYEHSKPFSGSIHDCTLHWEKEIEKTMGWIDIGKELPKHQPNEAIQLIVKSQPPDKKPLIITAVFYNNCFYFIEDWGAKSVHSPKLNHVKQWMYLPE